MKSKKVPAKRSFKVRKTNKQIAKVFLEAVRHGKWPEIYQLEKSDISDWYGVHIWDLVPFSLLGRHGKNQSASCDTIRRS